MDATYTVDRDGLPVGKIDMEAKLKAIADAKEKLARDTEFRDQYQKSVDEDAAALQPLLDDIAAIQNLKDVAPEVVDTIIAVAPELAPVAEETVDEVKADPAPAEEVSQTNA